jgi:filamentous hemagglutinin family protein
MYTLLSLKPSYKIIFSLFTSWLATILSDNTIQAQIIPDNSLGTESSLVTPNIDVDGIPSHRIDGGAIRGTNLFHSFQEFNVGEERGAYFTNPTGVESIFSRVTGTNLSNILGTLGVLGGSANLFLINPNGIIFGSNGSLDVKGSFVATTATNLNFADGTQFSTQLNEGQPLLTISIPISLGFGNNPGEIIVRGNGGGTRLTTDLIDTDFGLRVPPKEVIAFIGGNITIDGGTIKSPGGRIEIGSIVSPGIVGIENYKYFKNFSFNYTNILALGEIQLIQQAAVDASGYGAGDLQISGKNLLLANGSQIEFSTLANEPGGSATINISDTIEIKGTLVNGAFITPSGISTFVYPGATGFGANLDINARSLVLKESGAISTATLGMGSGGNLTIKADEIEVFGPLSSRQRAGGIATAVAPGATGNAGNLLIETDKLQISNGGTVSTTSLGLGKPGNIFVKATDFIELVGSASKETPSTLSARSIGTANSGNIVVETPKLNIIDGARTSVRNDGSGNAGNIEINSSFIYLDNQGSIAASTASGRGGNVILQAENLQIRRGSSITTDAARAGDGGNIAINTGTLVTLENSDITANAFEGNGGNIQIFTQGLFSTTDSEIRADSEFGIDGVVDIQTLGFEVENSLTPLQDNFITSEQVVAGSCLARRNADSNSFVVTGSGNLPTNPDSEPQEWESLSKPTTLSSEQSQDVPDSNFISARPWKLGDPIVEAQSIIRLPNGRVLLGRKSQKPGSAELIICKS